MNYPTTIPKWITQPYPRPQAHLRLFCFPHAGGGAITFRPWSSALSPSIEVCPIELPGRGARFRESPFTQMNPLIQRLSQAIAPYLDKPFAFFGHSMGALISFELTHALYHHCGQLPSCLMVSGRSAPQLPPTTQPIHTLPDAHFLTEVRQFNGLPDDVFSNQELMNLFLPILRADFTVIETYEYTSPPSLACEIAAFGGLQDTKVSIENLEAWREQTNQKFSAHLLPGDHFFLHSAQDQLLQILKTKLSDCK